MGQDIGTPERAHALLGEYYDMLPEAWMTDDTNALLGAMLMEQRELRRRQGGPDDLRISDAIQQQAPGDQGGTYFTNGGESVGEEWEQYEPGFVSSEVDLRFDSAIRVAFTVDTPTSDEKIIKYDAAISPVGSIDVATGNVWVRAESGTADVNVEVWG